MNPPEIEKLIESAKQCLTEEHRKLFAGNVTFDPETGLLRSEDRRYFLLVIPIEADPCL
jgi:hypothetical protein